MNKRRFLSLLLAASFVSPLACQQMREAVDRAEASGQISHQEAEKRRSLISGGQGLVQSRSKFTPEEEYYVGRSTAANILSSFPLVRDEQLTAYVNMVGLTLAGYSDHPAMYSPQPGQGAQGWHFAVVESDQINAFAAPGGFIFVTTGALRAMQSEDELAGVLAHEITHVDKEHGLDLVREELRRQGIADLAKGFGGPVEALHSFVSSLKGLMKAVTVDGHGVEQESEADKNGVRLAARAGYDPYALVRFIERTSARDDRWGGKTHPPSATRMSDIQMVLANYPYRGTDEQLRLDRFQATVGR